MGDKNPVYYPVIETVSTPIVSAVATSPAWLKWLICGIVAILIGLISYSLADSSSSTKKEVVIEECDDHKKKYPKHPPRNMKPMPPMDPDPPISVPDTGSSFLLLGMGLGVLFILGNVSGIVYVFRKRNS